MNHQAKKKFGQNFLRDKNLLQKIVRESHIENKHVIEVGPGQGALTSFLAEQATDVIAYEIDHSLSPILQKIEDSHHNLKVVYRDFLEADLEVYPFDLHVVANVPYYITTPILFKLLESPRVKTASLMIQKEVCDRLLAKPSSKEYNALSVILQFQAKAYKMMDVKRHLFYPVPNVDSAVIRIEKYEHKLIEASKEKLFVTFVKAAFKQKRKTLINNIHESFGISKPELEDFLVKHGVDFKTRAEALTLETFIKLVKEWPYDC